MPGSPTGGTGPFRLPSRASMRAPSQVGPASYDIVPEIQVVSRPYGTMGTARRSRNQTSETPGVGTYSLEKIDLGRETTMIRERRAAVKRRELLLESFPPPEDIPPMPDLTSGRDQVRDSPIPCASPAHVAWMIRKRSSELNIHRRSHPPPIMSAPPRPVSRPPSTPLGRTYSPQRSSHQMPSAGLRATIGDMRSHEAKEWAKAYGHDAPLPYNLRRPDSVPSSIYDSNASRLRPSEEWLHLPGIADEVGKNLMGRSMISGHGGHKVFEAQSDSLSPQVFPQYIPLAKHP